MDKWNIGPLQKSATAFWKLPLNDITANDCDESSSWCEEQP
jgi:hypothetical protein